MWLKLSTMWINMDNIVRVEMLPEVPGTMNIISVKPGGSDRTVVTGADIELVKEFFEPKPVKRLKKKSMVFD